MNEISSIEPIKFTTSYKIGQRYIDDIRDFIINEIKLIYNDKGHFVDLQGYESGRLTCVRKSLSLNISIDERISVDYEFIPEFTIGQEVFCIDHGDKISTGKIQSMEWNITHHIKSYDFCIFYHANDEFDNLYSKMHNLDIDIRKIPFCSTFFATKEEAESAKALFLATGLNNLDTYIRNILMLRDQLFKQKED